MKQRVLATAIAVAVAFAALLPVTIAAPVAAATSQAAQDPDESKIVEQILFEGNRRIPDDSMRLWVQTREGDPFSLEQVQRDVRTVLAQGYFDDVKVYTEEGPRGGLVVTFFVREYPVILQIDYPGLKSVSESDLLDEWRKRSISLSKESQFDPVKATRAARTIEQMLAAKGRPDATVTPEVENISPTAVALHFRTDEGERVRIAEIDFVDNQVFSDGELRGAMKLTKEAGIISGLQSKDTYDKERLAYDLEQVRLYYYDHGYLDVRFGEPVVEEAGRVDSGIPFVGGKDRGLKVTVPVEEGRVYRVGDVTIQGASVYPADVLERALGLVRGEVLSLGKVRKAIYEDLKKLYGERGYVNFTADVVRDLRDVPGDPTAGVADLHVMLDEGRSFVLDRLEFKGNTFTRDKVLRREVLLNEGEPFNKRLFDLSILRLNQLGYFDTIKETDADIRTDPRTGKVGVDLRVQEKGRQQVQFSGATAGTGGAFVGVQYSTNNLFGYGESLSVDMQTGNRTNRFAFSFTEPYLLDRPVSVGAQVYYQTYQFFGGTRAVDAGDPEPSDVLFTQKTVGGAVSLSTPLSYFFQRSALARFARLGLTYSYSTSSIDDPERSLAIDPTGTLSLTFQQPAVVTSTVVPSLTFSTLDGGYDPTRGQYLRLGLALSGGPAGGDVRTIQPSLEYQLYRPVSLFRTEGERRDVFAMRLVAGHVRSYGEPFATNSLSFVGGTPYGSRYFLGGEDTIRGFEVRSIAPISRAEQYLTQSGVHAETRSGRALRVAPGAIRKFTYEDLLVGQRLVSVGADTQLLGNFEYRIPVVGPVTFTAFADVGSAFNLRRLGDQFVTASHAGSALSPFVAINPRGRLATEEQIRDATTPETPEGALPAGFRAARFLGDQEVTTAYRFSRGTDGFLDNLRYSIGGEVRVMIPVVNVPFRIIFAHNPNARLGLGEERNVVKFGIGKTF